MSKPEAAVEDRLVAGALARSGRAAKMVDTGRRGAPDRILYLPGQPIWVETKAKDGRLAPWQERYHDELRSYGYMVLVLWTIEQVDNFWMRYDRGDYG
jgi:hypothetical protein